MSDIFNAEATSAQLKKLPDLPAEEGGIGVVATNDGDVGVHGAINKDIGQPGGFFLLAEGSWMRKAGGSVAGWFGWKGKGAK